VIRRAFGLAGWLLRFLPDGFRQRIWALYNRYWLYPRSESALERLKLPQNPREHLDLAALLQSSGTPGTRPDLIVLSILNWEERFQRPQHLALAAAAEGHRVFYIARPAGVGPENFDGPWVQQVAPGVFYLMLAPLTGVDFYEKQLSAAVTREVVGQIERLSGLFGIEQAVVKVDFPTWSPVAEALAHRWAWKIVYDCMEDHSDVQWGRPDLWQQDEHSLFMRSDVVLAASPALADKARASGARCVTEVPNGVALRHFQQPGPVPLSNLTRLPHPILGYFGIITDWFDVDMVLEAAHLRPDWTFLLIGNVVGIDPHLFTAHENIVLLGEQPYQKLPGYAQLFDVCLIPHEVRDRTNRSGSLKFFEYLSLGKPIITAPLSWLKPYADLGLVRFAGSGRELVSQTEAILASDSPEGRAERQLFAEQHAWSRRYERLWQAVRPCYEKASIVMVTYNNLTYTRNCLTSIFTKTRYPNYEIIVVDNGSTDGTPAYLTQLSQARADLEVIVNDQNLGFARANNQGIAASTGRYIVLLNNDTLVTRGWLGGLVEHLRDPRVGAVDPVTNMAGNEARIDVDYAMLESMDIFAVRYTTRHMDETLEVAMLPMFCLAMRREVYEEVGPLDERFGVGMFEDDDYARRLKLAGYKTIVAQDVFIHHIGNASFGQLGADAYRQVFEQNRALYEEKWGMPWEPPVGWQE
jgi:GT2 family glycosyltransferase